MNDPYQVLGVSRAASEDDIKKAKDLIRNVIEADVTVVPDREVLIFVKSLDDSAVTIGTRVWVASSEYWPERWRLIENVKLAFDEGGITIPFPQLTVHKKK